MQVARDSRGALLPRFSVPDMHLLDVEFPPIEALGADRYRLEPFGTMVT